MAADELELHEATTQDLTTVLAVLRDAAVAPRFAEIDPASVAADLAAAGTDRQWVVVSDTTVDLGLVRVWPDHPDVIDGALIQLIETAAWQDTLMAVAVVESITSALLESGYTQVFAVPDSSTRLVYQSAGFSPVGDFMAADSAGYRGISGALEIYSVIGEDHGPHYRFAHVVLPELLVRDAWTDGLDEIADPALKQHLRRRVRAVERQHDPGLLALARKGALDDWLHQLWWDVNAAYPPAIRRPATGLRGRRVTVDGRDAVLIEFPEPHSSPEAFFALVAPAEPRRLRRYLTYELFSEWKDRPDTPALLCEWANDTQHRNFGVFGDTTAETFLTIAEQRMKLDRPDVIAHADTAGRTVLFDLSTGLPLGESAEAPWFRAVLQLLPLGAWGLSVGNTDQRVLAYLRTAGFHVPADHVATKRPNQSGRYRLCRLAQQIGVTPSDCLVVTATATGAVDAEAAGMKPVVVRSSRSQAASLLDIAPDLVSWVYEGRDWPFEFKRDNRDGVLELLHADDPY